MNKATKAPASPIMRFEDFKRFSNEIVAYLKRASSPESGEDTSEP